MKFRIMGGGHHQDGINYVKGDVIESDLNLAKMFGKKFERIGVMVDEEEVSKKAPPAIPVPKASKTVAKKGKTPAKAKEKAKAVQGDVTDQFPLAQELELMILQTEDGEYNVVDQDVPDEMINKKPFPTKKATQKYLETFE